jgi:hypothetical protein
MARKYHIFSPSHLLPTPLKLELLFFMDSIWMSRELWRNVAGGLSAFTLGHFTITGNKWCLSRFPEYVSPPIMLDYLMDHMYAY